MIISHTFANKPFAQRWYDLANYKKDIDIYLEVPEKWTFGNGKGLTNGNPFKLKGEAFETTNYHVKLIDMNPLSKLGLGWASKKLYKDIKEIKPDIIYHIGTHYQLSLIECIFARNLISRESKVVVFSMRGPQHTISRLTSQGSFIKRIIKKVVYTCFFKYVRKNANAVICHYPEALAIFKKENYKCPIYISTQVGVRSDIFFFKPSESKRLREKYNLQDYFILGSVSRFNDAKGIKTIIDSLPKRSNYIYMIIGSGTANECDEIKRYIREKKLESKIIMTGFLSWEELPTYLSMLDCVIHVPKTTERWVETFSIAICQAMAVGTPVIGNDSGSVPYQIGRSDMIVKEGDVHALRDKIEYMINNKYKSKKIGLEMQKWCLESFDTNQLNKGIYHIFSDIHREIFDENKVDMTKFHPVE